MNRRQFLTAGAGLGLSYLVGCDSRQDTAAPNVEFKARLKE
jgi:hypothetical protein